MSESITTTTAAEPKPATGSVPPAAPARGSVSEGLFMREITELAQREADARAENARLKREVEEATGKAKALEEKAAERERAEAERQAQAQRETAKSAVADAAAKMRAHDPDAVLALLPEDAVTAAGNGESDKLTAALEALKKNKAWLFKPSDSRDTGGKPPADDKKPADAMAMTPEEYQAAREAFLKGNR